MRKCMFSEEGQWYKGNLHSHTTNSDGRLKPEEAVKLYKNHGYHFLCFSEHDFFTDLREKFDCEDFILLPGVEVSAYLVDPEKKCLLMAKSYSRRFMWELGTGLWLLRNFLTG